MHCKKLLVLWRRLLDTIFPESIPFSVWEEMTAAEFSRRAAPSRSDARLERLCAEASFDYRDPFVRAAVHALKYRGARRLGAVFGEILADALREEIAYTRLLSPSSATLLVAIPLSSTRFAERGFNQSEIIAAAMSAHLPKTSVLHIPELLMRIRDTESQTRMRSRIARFKNMRGCFALANPALVRGRDIIIVDDVITTGATASEAATALLAAGARSITTVAVAH